MRRRDFITLLGGAAAAWPLAAHAQRTKTPQVGILDPGVSHLFAAFRQGMRDLGYIEAQNISYVYRSAEGRPEFVPRLASELAGLQLDVIVTAATLPVRAVKDATSTIPIVFAALGDAVATGAVTNLARPGGNITGLSFLNTEISAKRLGLLRETLPGAGLRSSRIPALCARSWRRPRRRPATWASNCGFWKSPHPRRSRVHLMLP